MDYTELARKQLDEEYDQQLKAYSEGQIHAGSFPGRTAWFISQAVKERARLLSYYSNIQTDNIRPDWPSVSEIHNRFCGENGESCQACKLAAK